MILQRPLGWTTDECDLMMVGDNDEGAELGSAEVVRRARMRHAGPLRPWCAGLFLGSMHESLSGLL